MQKLRRSILFICFALIVVMTFSMGAAAEQNRQIENEGSVSIMGESGNSFFLCGNEITLPASGSVIYGTIDNLSGTPATLTDSAFTALTAGTDYTWWIYYDDTNDEYCLSFDGFVMSEPYSNGNLIGCYGEQAFAISIKNSTLLGNGEGSSIIYTYGVQYLSIANSTLIQNNNKYGVIAASDNDLTATVNDSILTSMTDDESSGGDAFVVNYTSETNACALTVTFSGNNTVTCYYDLLYSSNANENSSAKLNVLDDFSYTTYEDDAIYSAGDVTINAAEGVTVDLNSDYDSVDCGGDLTITGGGTVQLYSTGNCAVYSGGTINISDCTLNASTDSLLYGALEAENGINYNDLYLLKPNNGAVTQMKETQYYLGDNDFYLKISSLDESEVHYYDNNGTEITATDFEAAVASCDETSDYQFYTISTDIKPATIVSLAPDQSANFIDAESWADWAQSGITYVINHNLMGSTNKSKLYFSESITTSRAMMAQILYNLAGDPAVTAADITTYNNTFSDVDTAAWYYDAVVWATNEGLINGVGDGKFAPNANVTREQAVTMLWRYNGSTELSDSLIGFSDNDQVSSYAQMAFVWAVENRIIKGMPSADGTILSPKTDCTRAQMAVIVYNYTNLPD